MTTQMTCKQTKVDATIIKHLKIYCAHKGLLLHELYDEILNWFMRKRHDNILKGEAMTYFASPRDGRSINIKIRTSLHDTITDLCKDDAISCRRFLYTSLVLYHDNEIKGALENAY